MKDEKFNRLIQGILHSDRVTVSRLCSHFSGYHKAYRENPKNKQKIASSKHNHYLKIRSEDGYNQRRKEYMGWWNKTDASKKMFDEWYNKNRDRQLLLKRRWIRNNPSSIYKSNDPELALAFANVRKRDDNTCQWQGCGLKHRETTIHVHHIFPVSEYPDLELLENYMICYCAEHHAQFHARRGDTYSHIIDSRKRNDDAMLDNFCQEEKNGE